MLAQSEPSTVSGQKLYLRAKQILPGGTQLLSKRPEQFAPGKWPPYFERAKGVEITDIDGKTYIDMTIMGVGACLLGYSDPDVERAVAERLTKGPMATLNCVEEVQLAEKLLALHPWAGGVRYARGGGEAMAVAVRIARAFTDRDCVAFCGYHGWQDWYLAANLSDQGDQLQGHLLPGLEPRGVPKSLAGTAFPFTYNRIEELRELVKAHGTRLAAIVMEPTRSQMPKDGFLEQVREIADETGACLIFDEITIGFRLARGGAHLHFGVMPDIAVFAKALGNGIPVSAIIGRSDVMQAAQTSFISSTFWTDGLGPAAGLAVLNKMERVDIPAHLLRIGKLYKQGVEKLAQKHQLSIKVGGQDVLPAITFPTDQAAALQTLFTVRMLAKGFLAGASFYPSLAHQTCHVDAFLDAADPIFAELKTAMTEGSASARLDGLVKLAGFARLA